MSTTVYPNGIKVNCFWQDGTHIKEGENIPMEIQRKVVQQLIRNEKDKEIISKKGE
ncbi:hypothetical protein [Enterococcus casseliflavus]|uniref:hypothetical protein n=1 Tax=Enterococcus casseliflavus TaxID=37734 RepID=UPI0022E86F23|nr:hypothetical protein [Enterococcus casseliflavus]